MLRSWTALFVAVGVTLVATLTTAQVFAQGLNPTPTLVQRTSQNIDDRLEWINRRDCLDDVVYTFTLGSTGTIPQSADLHVWAATGGVLCEDQAARDDPGCKQVFQGDVFDTGSVQAITAEIRVRDILREGSGVLTTEQTEEVCDRNVSDKTDEVLRFFILDSGGNLFPGVATYTVSYDLVGPAAPSSVKAGIGEDSLIVTWNANSSDEFLGRYNVYADVAGGTPPGAGGEGGGGSTPTDGCTSDDLVPGEIPTVGYKTQTNASTTEAQAGGLTNGVLYAVGVSSVDNFNNAGPLSKLDCAIPEPVTGFFEAYRDAGGLGGGGYCALGATRSLGSAAFVGLAALAFIARRRRPRAAARRST
ncbi:MAG TPA: hypothetical protein VFZ53_13990 [Polyangiaceae bacterium]